MRFLYITLLYLVPIESLSDCLSLVKGAIAIDVNQCREVNPEKDFPESKAEYNFLKSLDVDTKKDFLNSYRGVVIEGLVVRSYAVNEGLGNSKGALSKEVITAFISSGPKRCKGLKKKRLAAMIDEACCSGGSDVPCLLGSSYVLKKVKVIGKESSSAGDQIRKKAEKSKDWQAGKKSFQARDYNKAIFHLEKAKSKKELDIQGHYWLGKSYWGLDRCSDAIASLSFLNMRIKDTNYWADEEILVRDGSFLLARCYARLNNAPAAAQILNGYLIDPIKYRRELKRGLKHKDFGWIKSSGSYQRFRKSAKDALAK